MRFLTELRRRNVIRVALLYVVACWLVLQVGDVLFQLLGVPDWGLKLVFGVFLLGLPVVLIFSWAYEITPEGIKRESEVTRSESIVRETGRKLDVAVIAVVLLGIVVALSDRFLSSPPDRAAETPSTASEGDRAASRSVPSERTAGGDFSEGAASRSVPVDNTPEGRSDEVSIAVLPFRDMSAEGDQDYFAEGIAEELLNALVDIKGLRVASRTSSFSFKGRNVNLPTIAEELGVTHILEGSVRTSGNRIRVTAQLIDVEHDAHLWSETFDRTLDDIFAIQDEITGQVLEALVSFLGQADIEPAMQALTSDPEAYRLYLQGRHLWRQRSPDALHRSIELFKKALAMDPEFARAWSNLAAAYLVLPTYDAEVPPDLYREEAVAAADRALGLQPDLGEAIAIKANSHQRACDWVAAEKSFRRAVAAEPRDPSTRHWYALFLAYAGRIEAAREQAEVAYRLDPLNTAIVSTVGDVEIVAGDFPRTIQLWEEAAQLGFDKGSRWSAGYAMVLGGDIQRGRRLMLRETAFQSAAPNPDLVEAFLSALEDPSHLRPLEDMTVAAFNQDRIGMYSATMLLAPVNSKALLDVIDEGALCLDPAPMPWLPQAAEIRGDPRFFEAYQEAGLVDYWREFGWPDRCEDLDPELADCP